MATNSSVSRILLLSRSSKCSTTIHGRRTAVPALLPRHRQQQQQQQQFARQQFAYQSSGSTLNLGTFREFHTCNNEEGGESLPSSSLIIINHSTQSQNVRVHESSSLRRPSALLPSWRQKHHRISTLHQPQPQPQQRHYHATPKREILPLIAGLGLIFVGRYSWKALQRMDEEWEEYQWQLQQYEKAHRNEFIKSHDQFKDGTLAVDVGTMFVKLAHNGNGLLVTREGARATFAGCVRNNNNSDSNDDDDDVLIGQQAMEKYWQIEPFHPERVSMARSNQKVLLQVITPIIQDALERATLKHSQMRSVVTVPPSCVHNTDDPRNPWNHIHSSSSSSSSSSVTEIWKHAQWIPEPVAAVWGSQVHGELPLHDLKAPVLVVDVGATATSLSVVQKDIVLGSVTMDFGAQVFMDAICEHVIQNQDGLATIRNDGMAWQRLVMAAQTAVQELNTQTYTQLNIPYIGMDLETRKPIHLDMRIGRGLIEQKVTEKIVTEMILKHQTNDSSKSSSTSTSILSPHVPVVPHNLSSLWMSVMTQLLTDIHQQPQDLGHVLLVGGGAKHALMESSIKECFAFFQTKVVVPALSTRSELVVLGASSILPQYEYDFESGLLRLEKQ